MEEKKDKVMKKETGVVSAERSLQQLSDKFKQKQSLVLLLKQQALGYLKPGDVVDQQGMPYVLEAGCQMIAKGFDISIINMTGPVKTEIPHSEGPKEIIFEYQAIAKAPYLGEIEVTGNCSTRDKFLGTKGGAAKELRDVDIPAIMKKACTNLRGTAIRKFLGLSNITWEELEKFAGIKKSTVVAIDRGGKSSMKKAEITENDKGRLVDIKKWTKELFEGNVKKAKDFYKEMTAFTPKDGEPYPGQQDPDRWSTAQIKRVHPKVKKRYDEFTAGRDQKEGKIPERDIDEELNMDKKPYDEDEK